MTDTNQPNMQSYYDRVIDGWTPMDTWQDDVDESQGAYEHNESFQVRLQALQQWAKEFNLQDKKVIEVGCGTGLLQHEVSTDYTGIDLAYAAHTHMEKPFVNTSATCLPFETGSFDAAYSFWVLEHIPNPEEMLAEMRRVVKPGGTIFLVAAYSVEKWISRGVHRRPIRELSFAEKIERVTIPVRHHPLYKIATTFPIRMWDIARVKVGKRPSSLRFAELVPNFEIYWDYDSDACASIDSCSTALYFQSRGDVRYPNNSMLKTLAMRSKPQIYIKNQGS